MVATLLVALLAADPAVLPPPPAPPLIEAPRAAPLPPPAPPPTPPPEVAPQPGAEAGVTLADSDLAENRMQRLGFGVLGTLPGIAAVSAVIWAADRQSKTSAWTSDPIGNALLWTVGGYMATVLIPIGAWLGFHLGGGDAPLGWAFLGYLPAVAAATILLALSGNAHGIGKIPFFGISGLLGALLPVLALELRQIRIVQNRNEPQVSMLVLPTQGGATVGLSITGW